MIWYKAWKLQHRTPLLPRHHRVLCDGVHGHRKTANATQHRARKKCCRSVVLTYSSCVRSFVNILTQRHELGPCSGLALRRLRYMPRNFRRGLCSLLGENIHVAVCTFKSPSTSNQRSCRCTHLFDASSLCSLSCVDLSVQNSLRPKRRKTAESECSSKDDSTKSRYNNLAETSLARQEGVRLWTATTSKETGFLSLHLFLAFWVCGLF